MSMTTLISKLLPLFVTSDKGQVNQVDISSSLGEPSLSSYSASSALPEPLLLSSSKALEEGEEATMKPPITTCRCVIRPTRVFTWHNSSLRVSRRASMRTSYVMMVSSVTPPTKEEGAEVDGVVEARGVVVSVRGCLEWSYARPRLMVAASMAHMKWGDLG